MSDKTHWEGVYATHPTDQLGWYSPHLALSLRWIEALGLDRDTPIIDVGGGTSTLVEDLLDRNYRALTLMDLADTALTTMQTRLGERAPQVRWLHGDITEVTLPAQGYGLWHDRAVFHFLTRPEHQARYREQLQQALRPGGHLLIGTFGPEAPPRCSGLPVQRYDLVTLQQVLGDTFTLQRHDRELHVTPGGIDQCYLYALLRHEP